MKFPPATASRKKHFRRRTAHLCMTAAAMLLCTACFSGDRTGTSGDAPEPAEQSPTGTYDALHSVGDGPQAPETGVQNLEWQPGDEDSAKETAVNALRDFARPEMEENQWANDLARWLTPQATADYSSVDPANIPASSVTGPAKLTIDETNGFGVTAAVPTNAGTYTVQLLRTDKNSPWKVNRFTPPSS